LVAAYDIADPAFVDPLVKLMDENDPVTRRRACDASYKNWNEKFVAPLIHMLSDTNREVASLAQYCLRGHSRDVHLDSAVLRKMLLDDGPASLFAFEVLQMRGEISDQDRVQLLSSTNLAVVSSAFTPLRSRLKLKDLAPLMNNSLPMARFLALGVLSQMTDKPAVDRIVSMLHDPNEAIRWRVRSTLRHLTGQQLGSDPAAYEKWWAENRETYTPRALQSRAW
jgi:HEAT repeat protein